MENSRCNFSDVGAIFWCNTWFFCGIDCDNKGAFVEDFVVLQIIHKRRWCFAQILKQEDRSSRNALHVFGLIENFFNWAFSAMDAISNEHASTAPGLHLDHQNDSNCKCEPATVWDFDQIGAKESQFNNK